MLSNDIKKYIGEISGASARHFANATRADESGDDALAARLRVEAHVLLAVAVKLDQILSVNEPKKEVPPQLNKHDVIRSGNVPCADCGDMGWIDTDEHGGRKVCPCHFV